MTIKITREQIIEAIYETFKDNPYVYALWLEGADATGSVDEYSDLDIWLDVENGKEDSVFVELERNLNKLSPLDFNYEQEQSHPQIRHKIYHIKNTSDTLLLDVCIQSHSREFVFTKNLPGEEVKIIFDKSEVIKFKEFDEALFNAEQKQRVFHLKHIFLQESRVIKMIKRGQFIDAFNFYKKYILEPLSEIIRIRYAPRKQIFMKYISRDLPQEVAKQLESLYQVNSLEELNVKIRIAKKMFKNVAHELGCHNNS